MHFLRRFCRTVQVIDIRFHVLQLDGQNLRLVTMNLNQVLGGAQQPIVLRTNENNTSQQVGISNMSQLPQLVQ